MAGPAGPRKRPVEGGGMMRAAVAGEGHPPCLDLPAITQRIWLGEVALLATAVGRTLLLSTASLASTLLLSTIAVAVARLSPLTAAAVAAVFPLLAAAVVPVLPVPTRQDCAQQHGLLKQPLIDCQDWVMVPGQSLKQRPILVRVCCAVAKLVLLGAEQVICIAIGMLRLAVNNISLAVLGVVSVSRQSSSLCICTGGDPMQHQIPSLGVPGSITCVVPSGDMSGIGAWDGAAPGGLFLFALGHDVHHPASLVAARAAHALDVADGGGIRVKADNQIHLQGMVLV
ncbi:MAG: hypothetical protein FRX49_03025 [Trebouxia sp. A1-2]|nr:MAG: hypothetical protein FRX49_03025 [Trebouxia sp. A1-2]